MKRREKYSVAYRAEAVKMVLGQGLSIAEAARRLGMPRSVLHSWVTAAKGGSSGQGEAVPGARTVSELEAELAKLRGQLRESQMECDILKKATAYFAQGSLPGTRK